MSKRERYSGIDAELAALGEPVCSGTEGQLVDRSGFDDVRAVFALGYPPGDPPEGEGTGEPVGRPEVAALTAVQRRRVWTRITARAVEPAPTQAGEPPGARGRAWGWISMAVAASVLLALWSRPRPQPQPGGSGASLEALAQQARVGLERLEQPRGETRARALAHQLSARLERGSGSGQEGQG